VRRGSRGSRRRPVHEFEHYALKAMSERLRSLPNEWRVFVICHSRSLCARAREGSNTEHSVTVAATDPGFYIPYPLLRLPVLSGGAPARIATRSVAGRSLRDLFF
jgi:hypothetical protein